MTASSTPDRVGVSLDPPRFRRQGGAWQLCLESLSDLRHALELDDALWVANSAPLSTLAADPVFLEWLDRDGDGRIRVDSVRAAIAWLLDHLQPEPLGRPGEVTLTLDAIRTDGSESDQLLAAARKVVGQADATEARTISLDQVRRIIRQVEEGGLDLPGRVRPEAGGADGDVRELIEDVVATSDATTAEVGQSGIGIEQLEGFLTDVRRYLSWLDESRLPEGSATSRLMPLGEGTMAAYDRFVELAPRVDHYFALCDAVRFRLAQADSWGAARGGGPPTDWNDPRAVQSTLERAPVAWPTPEGRLDLGDSLNPHWRESLETFNHEALAPLLAGSGSGLNGGGWQRIKEAFAPHAEWRARRPDTPVGRIPPERLRRYLDRGELADRVRALIRDSHGTAFDLDNVRRLEKLLLFQAELPRLARSFVNFSDLYRAERRAMFEMGTLIMDGRRFTFSVKVADRALHARFSNTSNMFVLYAEITGDNGEKLYEVAVPVTTGTKGTLQVDKWGTFFDCGGRALNARILQIVENPVSLREAIAAPFKRLGRALMARFGEKSAEEEKKLAALTSQTLVSGKPLTEAAPAEKPHASPALANPGGLLAGSGIAIAALGSSLAFVTKTLSELAWTTIIAGFLGAVAAVIVPVTVVALVKLSGRDLSCMLEGSGWGINARMALIRSLARTFTQRPLPAELARKARVRRWFWWTTTLLVLVLGTVGLYFLRR